MQRLSPSPKLVHPEDSRPERDAIPSGSGNPAEGRLIKAIDGFDAQDLCSGNLAERFCKRDSGVGHGIVQVQPQFKCRRWGPTVLMEEVKLRNLTDG
jgi:hypothetical protein